MNIFIGIDPSINSTGITIRIFDQDKLKKERFYIVKANKLTKREQEAAIALSKIFEFGLYEKVETSEAEDNHEFEYIKTKNFIGIIDTIWDCIYKQIKRYINKPENNIVVVQEGISYGSTIRTKSVFDLAGLNYLIRTKFITNVNLQYIIATPAEIKKFATGMGNCKKDAMINMFSTIHPELKLKKLDDVADSYFMACFGQELLKNKNKVN